MIVYSERVILTIPSNAKINTKYILREKGEVIIMNKTQFARTLAEKGGISYKQGAEEVDRFLATLHEVVAGLGDGEALNLTGSVKFTVKNVPARIARNPQTGDEVQVDATRSVRASIGATLKSAVKEA